MRKFLYTAVAVGLVAVTSVALASASRTAPRTAKVSPAESNSYLPAGEAPLTDNWTVSGGDYANTMYSQLNQINSTNVGSLKVVWNGSYRPAGLTSQLSQAPLCCPDNLMFQETAIGMVAINPGDGTVVWEYQGAKSDTVHG